MSCGNKTYYYIDENSNDTIASGCFINETETKSPRYRIIIRNIKNYMDKESLSDIISKTGISRAFYKETKGRPFNMASRIFLYDYKGCFSNIHLGNMYNDENYYMKGEGIYYDSEGKIVYHDFEEHENIKKEKQKEFERKEKAKKDSIAYILAQKEVELSFMEYKIGSLYSKTKKKKLDANIIMNGDYRTILDSKFRIGVQHYKDTIYKITLYAVDYRNGISTGDIEELYKTKYANGNDGNISSETVGIGVNWSSKFIQIETEKLRFKNGEINFVKKYGDDRNTWKVTEFSIIYLNSRLEEKVKLQKELEKKEEIKKWDKEQKSKKRQAFNDI